MHIQTLFNVKGDIVLITGVSGQLGKTYARAFLEAGAKVVGLDLSSGIHSEVLRAEYSDDYSFIKADVTSKQS